MKYAAWIIRVLVLPGAVLAGPTSAPLKSQFEKDDDLGPVLRAAIE
jgi:hypothetical protein